jgi:hypothetical protein
MDVMKVNILDAHDRLKHFGKQSDYISEGCRDCINNRPSEFGSHPFYIFAHTRTDEDGVSKRLIWIPRLSKPKAQTNSMLFKAYPGTDIIKVIWMIPDRVMWDSFKKDNLTESQVIIESIHNFTHNREKLEAKEEDDLWEYKIDDIYSEISRNAQYRKLIKENL